MISKPYRSSGPAPDSALSGYARLGRPVTADERASSDGATEQRAIGAESMDPINTRAGILVILLMALGLTGCQSAAVAVSAAARSEAAVPLATAAPVTLSQTNAHLSIVCRSNTVTIDGSDNVITILGSCSAVTVTGSHNELFLQQATSFTDTGSENVLRDSGAEAGTN
jgi:hypothetical protein